jgi:hypothetical protein
MSPITVHSSSNIFKNPLDKSKAAQITRQKRQKNRNRMSAYTYLTFALVLLMTYSFLFLYPQVQQFLRAPATLQTMEDSIEEYDRVILPTLKKTRDLKKSAYDEQAESIRQNIDRIFPLTIDKLGIVRRLENFATAIHAKNPPFEFDSIIFGSAIEQDLYVILPISTTIHSSRANFDRFIELVNLSGRIDNEIPIRLMEISNISIRYRGVDNRTGKDQGVDFTVKLNAYSRRS